MSLNSAVVCNLKRYKQLRVSYSLVDVDETLYCFLVLCQICSNEKAAE